MMSLRASAKSTVAGKNWISPVSVVAVLVAWFVLTSATQIIPATRFPSPEKVYAAAVQLTSAQGYAGSPLWSHLAQSVKLVTLGFIVALLTGIPIGLLMGWNKSCEAFISPIFSIIRPIPPLAWIPLSIVWFGLGDTAKVFVIWLSAFVPAVINSFAGMREVDRTYVEAARVHGASTWRVLLSVMIPAAAPMILTGARVSLQVCWNALVAAELVGSVAGLGHVLNVASLDLYPGMILFAMLLVGLIGGVMTYLLSLFEARVLQWTTQRS